MGNSAFAITAGGSNAVRRLLDSPANKFTTGVVSIDDVYSAKTAVTGMYSLATNGSLVVTIGVGATYYTSPDGVTWTSRSLPASPYSNCTIVYIGGVFLYIKSTTQYYTSTDGINWTLRSLPATINTNHRVSVANTLCFLFLGTTNATMYYTSTDGINWTVRTAPATYNGGGSIVGINGQYLLDFNPNGYKSSDGITWTSCPIYGGRLAYANSTYVFFTGNEIYVSTDFSTWTKTKDFSDCGYGGLLLSNGSVLCVLSESYTYFNGVDTSYDSFYTLYKTDPYSALTPIKKGQSAGYIALQLFFSANQQVKHGSKYIIIANDGSMRICVFDPTNTYETVTER